MPATTLQQPVILPSDNAPKYTVFATIGALIGQALTSTAENLSMNATIACYQQMINLVNRNGGTSAVIQVNLAVNCPVGIGTVLLFLWALKIALNETDLCLRLVKDRILCVAESDKLIWDLRYAENVFRTRSRASSIQAIFVRRSAAKRSSAASFQQTNLCSAILYYFWKRKLLIRGAWISEEVKVPYGPDHFIEEL